MTQPHWDPPIRIEKFRVHMEASFISEIQSWPTLLPLS